MKSEDVAFVESVLRRVSRTLRELAESADLAGKILSGSRTIADREALPHAKAAELVDDSRFVVRWSRRECRLGQSIPFRLFRRLAVSLDGYVSQDDLLEEVWGTATRAPSTIRNAVSRLRRKLEAAGMDDLAAAIDGSSPGYYGLFLDRLGQPPACDTDATRVRR